MSPHNLFAVPSSKFYYTYMQRKPVLLMYEGGVVLLRNFPSVGEVRIAVLTRFRERAIRSYRTIDRVGLVNATSRRSLRLLCGKYG